MTECSGCGFRSTTGAHHADCPIVQAARLAPRRSITPFAPFALPPAPPVDREAPTRPENLPPPTISDVLSAVWKVGADVATLTRSVSDIFTAVQEVPALRAEVVDLRQRVEALERRRPTAAE